jgi:hypothetical protein
MSIDTSRQGGKARSGRRIEKIGIELQLLLAPSCFKITKISMTCRERNRQIDK